MRILQKCAKMQDANAECVGPESSDAGKADSCAGCPNQSLCSSGELKQRAKDESELIQERMSNIRHKILVLSGKGGVGKSSVSAQLCWTLSDLSAENQIGLMDIDICGPSAPKMMGVEEDEVHRHPVTGWAPVYAADNLAVMSVGFMLGSKADAVIWRGPKKNGLIKQFLCDVDWGELDYLVVDAPPGTSDEHISIAQYLKGCQPDGAIIVTTPQEVALIDVMKEITFCRKVGLRIIGVLENMSGFICPCCQTRTDIFGPSGEKVQKMCAEMNVDYLGSLPLDPDMLKCCEQGKSYTSSYPENLGAKMFKEFVQKVVNRIQ